MTVTQFAYKSGPPTFFDRMKKAETLHLGPSKHSRPGDAMGQPKPSLLSTWASSPASQGPAFQSTGYGRSPVTPVKPEPDNTRSDETMSENREAPETVLVSPLSSHPESPTEKSSWVESVPKAAATPSSPGKRALSLTKMSVDSKGMKSTVSHPSMDIESSPQLKFANDRIVSQAPMFTEPVKKIHPVLRPNAPSWSPVAVRTDATDTTASLIAQAAAVGSQSGPSKSATCLDLLRELKESLNVAIASLQGIDARVDEIQEYLDDDKSKGSQAESVLPAKSQPDDSDSVGQAQTYDDHESVFSDQKDESDVEVERPKEGVSLNDIPTSVEHVVKSPEKGVSLKDSPTFVENVVKSPETFAVRVCIGNKIKTVNIHNGLQVKDLFDMLKKDHGAQVNHLHDTLLHQKEPLSVHWMIKDCDIEEGDTLVLES